MMSSSAYRSDWWSLLYLMLGRLCCGGVLPPTSEGNGGGAEIRTAKQRRRGGNWGAREEPATAAASAMRTPASGESPKNQTGRAGRSRHRQNIPTADFPKPFAYSRQHILKWSESESPTDPAPTSLLGHNSQNPSKLISASFWWDRLGRTRRLRHTTW